MLQSTHVCVRRGSSVSRLPPEVKLGTGGAGLRSASDAAQSEQRSSATSLRCAGAFGHAPCSPPETGARGAPAAPERPSSQRAQAVGLEARPKIVLRAIAARAIAASHFPPELGNGPVQSFLFCDGHFSRYPSAQNRRERIPPCSPPRCLFAHRFARGSPCAPRARAGRPPPRAQSSLSMPLKRSSCLRCRAR